MVERVPMSGNFKLICTAAILMAGILLDGCQVIDPDTAQISEELYHAVIGHGEPISRETAAAVTFASIGVALGSNDQAMLVLGTETGGELHWFSSNGVMIATRDGRIVSTAGLPFNLGRAGALASGPSGGPGQLRPITNTAYLLQYDLPDLQLYSLVAQCQAHDEGSETIEIIGAQIETRHVVEDCEIKSLEWSFENEFWMDRDTNYIWRSIQIVHPKLPAIAIDVLRSEK
jgi:hypothetical protein